jgi:hypothetical protein
MYGNDDCNDAIIIFDDFHLEFEKLYGKDEMTFNLHAHSHFPQQVMDFGQLNKRAAFCFENKFMHTRNLFKGTVNFDGQIAQNLNRKQQIIIELRDIKQSSNNIRLNSFIDEFLLGIDSYSRKDNILKLKNISVTTLKDFEVTAVRRKFLMKELNEILTGSSAIINFNGISKVFCLYCFH